MPALQPSLFPQHLRLPEGFRFEKELLSPGQECALVDAFTNLDFREFEFRGFLGKRRTVSFGWHYDFNARELQPAANLPDFLSAPRKMAARFAGLNEEALQHVLITEYAPGAAIGWHRDRAEFEDIIGISLGASCKFRFRRKLGARWERVSIELPPRSAYLLRGASRTEWQHSIPPVEMLRYSVTFRTLQKGK